MAPISAFFYGTLMHPKILTRVIHNDGSHLQICQAVLLKYTRHKVKFADYPGIVPYSQSHVFFDQELDRDACSVRGTMVTGLTKTDLQFLDIFEGDTPWSASPTTGCSPPHPPPLPSDADLPEAVEVDTYVFNEIGRLMSEIWDFDDFVTKNAWKWFDSGARDNPDFTEVDRRQAEGTPVQA
ncbi:Phosphoric monoester hydrolase [Mycena sanguinolenta]|uniref:Putative gamma-glutamylcyclotransferase n=1 Tax=Mycena sanguinolenta TaxID=230812 RepID=A0A8H7DJR0_9AGAR|nr:Phosphoric monoester hydrolase [Mycena sanguinolenta]